MKTRLTLGSWITIRLVLFLGAQICAAESRLVRATGEAAVVNITAEEAQKLALKRARLNAIEEVCGTRLQAETFVSDHSIQGSFIHTVSYGQIVSEEVLRWQAEIIQESPKDIPGVVYRVAIRAKVLKEVGRPDPFYKVNVKLNKTVFHAGDEMVIYVSTTKPSYITVLNFSADDKVIVLFPNQIRRHNRIKPGKEYQIPSAADRDGVLKLQVSTLPGHKSDTEYIKVIATREPIHLLSGLFVQGQYGVMDTVKVAVTEIARLISSIPVKDRAEATATYQIFSRD